MRAVGACAVGVLVVLLIAGCAAHAAAPGASKQASTPAGTVTEVFHAYDASGQLIAKVGDVAGGSCWTTSIAAPVAGAYRCMTANKILDPCFAPTHPQTPAQVACFATPWSDAIVLQLTAGLPAADPGDGQGAAARRPWAFRLGSGVRCVASTGTVPAVHGVDLGYHCTDGRDAALLPTSGATTTADYGDASSQTVHAVPVQTIWRG